MKKILLFTTAALLFSGISFADNHKGKKKKNKSKTCCSKSSKKCSKEKTAEL